MKYLIAKIIPEKPLVDSEIGVPEEKLVNITEALSGTLIPRVSGQFCGKAIYLSATYNWVLAKDDEDEIVLIPLTK